MRWSAYELYPRDVLDLLFRRENVKDAYLFGTDTVRCRLTKTETWKRHVQRLLGRAIGARGLPSHWLESDNLCRCLVRSFTVIYLAIQDYYRND